MRGRPAQVLTAERAKSQRCCCNAACQDFRGLGKGSERCLGQTQHGEPDVGDGDSAIAPTSEREPIHANAWRVPATQCVGLALMRELTALGVTLPRRGANRASSSPQTRWSSMRRLSSDHLPPRATLDVHMPFMDGGSGRLAAQGSPQSWPAAALHDEVPRDRIDASTHRLHCLADLELTHLENQRPEGKVDLIRQIDAGTQRVGDVAVCKQVHRTSLPSRAPLQTLATTRISVSLGHHPRP